MCRPAADWFTRTASPTSLCPPTGLWPRRRERTWWARGRWTSKCHISMLVCPRNTLKLVNQQTQERTVQNLTQGTNSLCSYFIRCLNSLFIFRRYKTQLKDFLSSCRTKKAKSHDIYGDTSSFPGYPNPAAAAYIACTQRTRSRVFPLLTVSFFQEAQFSLFGLEFFYISQLCCQSISVAVCISLKWKENKKKLKTIKSSFTTSRARHDGLKFFLNKFSYHHSNT